MAAKEPDASQRMCRARPVRQIGFAPGYGPANAWQIELPSRASVRAMKTAESRGSLEHGAAVEIFAIACSLCGYSGSYGITVQHISPTPPMNAVSVEIARGAGHSCPNWLITKSESENEIRSRFHRITGYCQMHSHGILQFLCPPVRFEILVKSTHSLMFRFYQQNNHTFKRRSCKWTC
jgi:hypothetical protein